MVNANAMRAIVVEPGHEQPGRHAEQQRHHDTEQYEVLRQRNLLSMEFMMGIPYPLRTSL